MKKGEKRSVSGLRCPWTAWYCDCKSTLNAWPYPADGKVPKRCQEMMAANAGMAPKKEPPLESVPTKRAKQAGKSCPYCGRLMGGRIQSVNGLFPTIDHIVPISRGGQNREVNKVFVCRRCNEDKDNKLIAEWLEELISRDDARAEVVWLFMQRRGVSLCVGLE